MKADDKIILTNSTNSPIALMNVESIYNYDKKEYAEKTYGTLDKNHPGVYIIFNYKEKLIGGELFLINAPNQLFQI
ncbi:Sulfate adenylyltransferase [subsurface metagenome]